MAQNAPKSEAARAAKGERIAKFMARAGLCSRRDAEKWIAEGRVSIDGTPLASPACNVMPGQTVAVDGQVIQGKEVTRLWRYHKPSGVVTTARDPQARPTVFDNLPKSLPRVISVGRLDLTTEGLLLLTNDGALARYLELPRHAWERHYRVRVHGRVSAAKLARPKDGISIDGVHYGPVAIELERTQGSNSWVRVCIKEGKNREIRKLMEHLDLQVTRLIRIAFGPFPLADLSPGAVEEVPQRLLKTQLAQFFTTET
ncbi:MAG: pseudouridine synthase [Alphaproteobacteria bacterium]